MEAEELKKEKSLKESEKKWGVKQIESGFTVIPSLLITRQKAIGLDAIDLNILMHIIVRWWAADNHAFPSKKLIAESMGIDVSTVRRRVARMENEGILKREKRFIERSQTSNKYDLSKLVASLLPFAEEELKSRRENAEKRVQKRSKKRPMAPVTEVQANA